MLKFGIIGCGRIAQRHAEQMMGFGKLMAVCDIDAQKAQALSGMYKAQAYTNLEAFLEQAPSMDLVAVCTPNYLHAEHTVKALRKGVHVICEKPMAIHSADCREMISVAHDIGKQLFIVKQNRFNPPVQAVKELLERKKLGMIYSVHLNCIWNRNADYYTSSDWKGKKEKDGGILYTQFSHFIDLLYWFFGELAEAKAFVTNVAHEDCIEFEDTTVASLRFQNGILGSAHFSINSYQKNREGSLTIIAEKGMVKIGGEYLNKLEYQYIQDSPMTLMDEGKEANDYGSYQGSMSNHHLVYQHVEEVLTKGIKNEFDGTNGLKTVEMIEKIYQAADATHH
ncbi:MAG: Gfo/Idh/MocA family oxidoreductase [Bacteroidetes bacterium]|nr:Gfo/Idh/MocA family oxidoreductase [Bacteroidota bacterium]